MPEWKQFSTIKMLRDYDTQNMCNKNINKQTINTINESVEFVLVLLLSIVFLLFLLPKTARSTDNTHE